MNNLNTILAIAYRDFTKFRQDRGRILATFIFPIVFVGILGSSLQSNLSQAAGLNFLIFTFTGVIGQTLFQSTASGLISLIQDRETDFAQEMFVSPVSRYSIIIGKILGESSVAMVQGTGVLLFGFIMGIHLSFSELLAIFPAALVICLLGGSFGLLVLSNLSEQRSANQIFPFIIFPQFFLAGVFSPIKNLPIYLSILSKISPMTYAVDLIRGVYYLGKPEYSRVVLSSPLTNLLIIALMFTAFLFIGTYLFVRNERNR
ncbi:MAG: ABC transporter permease [bacterium]|nr:ABC transporter permease [bacterium]